MKRSILAGANVLLGIIILGCSSPPVQEPEPDSPDYEVWVIDQSDSAVDGGGTLHIYDGVALSGPNPGQAVPEVVDLGGEARLLCGEQTGSAPQRPHMILFNGANSHAVVSFVASGHVLFLDAATRKPVACLDAGAQAHAAVPSPDQRHVVVANQNGKLLQRINTDYAANSFTLDEAATLNLGTCMTPSGAKCEDPMLRPDNAPICPIIDDRGLVFTTLRGGGLLVVDSTATPMSIVGEYDQATVHPNGCGGVVASGKMYINSGGGTAANPLESDLYAFPLQGFSTSPSAPNTPAPKLVFSHDDQDFVDSHGATLAGGQRYLWVGDRAANRIVVVDTQQDTVAGEIALPGPLSEDPAPDLMDVSPDGSRVFLALRGVNPLTANAAAANNAVGSSPGMAVVRVDEGGQTGTVEAVLRITRMVEGTERADPHGLRVRMR